MSETLQLRYSEIPWLGRTSKIQETVSFNSCISNSRGSRRKYSSITIISVLNDMFFQ